MVKIVSRSEFARTCGVSAAAVTKACNGALKNAVHGRRIDAEHESALAYREHKLREQQGPAATGFDNLYEQAIDVCEEMERYSINVIQKKLKIGNARAKKIFTTMQAAGVVPEKGQESKKVARASGHTARNEDKKNSKPITEIVPENMQEFADMSLRELITKFGTDLRFVDWLKSIKLIEDIEEKRIKNAASSGELVNRKLIRVGILDPVESTHRKLLTDGSKRMSVRVRALGDAGHGTADIEKFISKQITSFIKPMKAKVSKALQNVKS